MKTWLCASCLVAAFGLVPMAVYWLRHRPHRLQQGTQPIVLAGLLVQFALLGLAGLILWLL